MLADNSGPLPFTGYERATREHPTRPVTHWYQCIGWLPERLSWAYDLIDNFSGLLARETGDRRP